jgi:hypothetical protein
MKPGGGRVHDRVEMGCYAGGRGDETLRVVLLGGRELSGRLCARGSSQADGGHDLWLGTHRFAESCGGHRGSGRTVHST